MSAATGLAKQADGLEKLLTLASLKKEDVAAAGEETRRQMQLTQQEEHKIAEAKSYIARHAVLEADLQRREDELAASKEEYGKLVSDFSAYVASENTRLETFSAKLDARDKQGSGSSAQLEQEKNTFAGLKLDHERQHRDLIASCQKREAENNAVSQANSVEAQRLKDWEATLKRKAELARQSMANF